MGVQAVSGMSPSAPSAWRLTSRYVSFSVSLVFFVNYFLGFFYCISEKSGSLRFGNGLITFFVIWVCSDFVANGFFLALGFVDMV